MKYCTYNISKETQIWTLNNLWLILISKSTQEFIISLHYFHYVSSIVKNETLNSYCINDPLNRYWFQIGAWYRFILNFRIDLQNLSNLKDMFLNTSSLIFTICTLFLFLIPYQISSKLRAWIDDYWLSISAGVPVILNILDH